MGVGNSFYEHRKKTHDPKINITVIAHENE